LGKNYADSSGENSVFFLAARELKVVGVERKKRTVSFDLSPRVIYENSGADPEV